ncbi:propanol dehydrogenase [Listeria monocytogenes FSL F6-684]|nr:propanol dehydrogenase [Listeria monocytogenes FSL F6-684]
MNSFQIKTKVAFGTNSLQVLKEIKNKNCLDYLRPFFG